MSANTETTGAPEGYAPCVKKCGRWTEAGSMMGCWTCCVGVPNGLHGEAIYPDWTPPIAVPAAHVERRKGQRWKSSRTMARGDTLIVTGTLMQRLDSEDGWTLSDVERSDGIGAFGSCFVDSLWSNPSETMTLLADTPPKPAKSCESCGGNESTCGVHGCPGGKIKTCPTCEWAMSDCVCTPPVQEAQKAAPVCSRCCNGGYVSNVAFEQGLIKMCIGCRDNLAVWMRSQAGKPYAGPERLSRPQIAADWVEDCLGDVR